MKKIILTLGVVVSSTTLFSQTLYIPGSLGTSTNAGKVGIGTSSPLRQFEIQGSQTAAASLGDNTEAAIRINNWNWNQGKRSEIQFGIDPTNNNTKLATIAAEYTNYGSAPGGSIIFGTSNPNSTAVTERLRISPDGKVGIGNSSPTRQLDIQGSQTAAASLGDNTEAAIRINNWNWNQGKRSEIQFGIDPTNNNTKLATIAAEYTNYGSAPGGSIIFGTSNPNSTDVYERMRISPDGRVGIGTTLLNDNYLLSVDGKIRAEEIKVYLSSGWADYVFDKDYALSSLNEVESYIEEYHHLPNVPSVGEVEEQGINLGEMDAILLRKIEELTLYMIQLKKENEELKELIKAQ